MWSASIAAPAAASPRRARERPRERGRPQRGGSARATVRVGGGVRTKLRSRVVPASLAEDDLDAQGAYFALERSPCALRVSETDLRVKCDGHAKKHSEDYDAGFRARATRPPARDPCDATRTAPRHYPFALLPFPFRL